VLLPVVAKLPVLISKLVNLVFCSVFKVSTDAYLVSKSFNRRVADAVKVFVVFTDAVKFSIEPNLLFAEAVKVFVSITLAVNDCRVETFVSFEPVYAPKSAAVAAEIPLTLTEPVTCKL
jgi:hypothetical protein